MAVYCTSAEVKSILSDNGVLYAADDDRSGDNSAAELTYIDDAIERMSSMIDVYLVKYYDLTTLSSSNAFLKWCCATLSAMELMSRRGQQPPPMLAWRASQYEEILRSIGAGNLQIPGATPLHAAGIPAMCNLEFDQRYRVAKIRIVQPTSTNESSELPLFYSNVSRNFYN